MGYLYGGTILRVDLTNRKVSKEDTAPYTRHFIGGRGINTKIIYDGVGPEVKPLDPENIITFGAGPLVGTRCPASGRTHAMAKSPETNLLGATSIGGYWAPELKFAGYDHVVVQGRAEKPVYIFINNENVEIKDADSMWGKDTYETQEIIKIELGDPKIQMLCIGPAGERLVSFACIISGTGNVGSRTGMGAVMGSKNLKAIAVRGTRPIKIAQPEKFRELCKEVLNLIRQNDMAQLLSKEGTTSILSNDGYYKMGYAGIRNWQTAEWDRPERQCVKAFWEKYGYKRSGCFGCPTPCMEIYRIPDIGDGVAKCSMYMDLMWPVGNSNMLLWWEAALLCQKGGIDTTSVGGIIGWLMELYQRGIITEKDTNGILMRWGSREAIITMIKKIVNREGVGDLLANGILKAAKKIGKGSINYAVQTKGLPNSALDLRAYKGIGFGGAVGTRKDVQSAYPIVELDTDMTIAAGYDEKKVKEVRKNAASFAGEITGISKASIPSEYEGKAALVEYYENIVAIADMLGICKFLYSWGRMVPPEKTADLYSAGKGTKVAIGTLFEATQRVRCLERAYEVREDVTRRDDTLPKKFFESPIMGGRHEGDRIDRNKFEKMKDEYYELRGWDVKTGIPTRETLERYGLKYVASDLKKRDKLPLERKEAKKENKPKE